MNCGESDLPGRDFQVFQSSAVILFPCSSWPSMQSVSLVTPPAGRRLTLRRRRDLVVSPQTVRGETVWAVKDPVSLQYFHFRDEEYWILEQLDGTVTLSELQGRFAERFAPSRLEQTELQTFLGTLHQSGLILADAPGQGDELLRRARDQSRREWRQRLANPLAIRFRGFDPERLLERLAPLYRVPFSPWCLAIAAAWVLSAIVLVATRFDVLQTRLPAREAFFSPGNLVWIGIVLAFTKVLHELGHALTLKQFGGECHEMGVMLLVFTPCLYCNVTDAWMLPSKWQRAMVGAAGIVVELLLAATCTYLWWFSEPGLFNSLCLNVMFVCSVSTLLINGNPLFRYDGYFVLADLTETPNLARQGMTAFREALAHWFLGIELPRDEDLPLGRRVVLAAYCLASLAYRMVVLFGVLWFVYKALQPHRMEVFAELLVLAVAGGFVVSPLWQLGRFLSNPYWRRKVKTRRAVAGGFAVLLIAATLLAIPLPHRVVVPVLLQPADARRVYAAVGGRLAEGVAEGASVAAGQTIAVLENSDLALEIEKLRGQRDQQQLRVANLKRRQVQDLAAAAELPPAEELLADYNQRLEEKSVDEKRLTIAAPIAGTVLPPRRHQPQPIPGALPSWSGTPLDPLNAGCTLEAGTLVCQIGDPTRMEALLIIDQADIEFVAPGQTVEILLDQSPGTIFSGTISELAEIDLQVTPPELVAAGEMAVRTDPHGRSRPSSTSYQARVRFESNAEQPLLIGESGRAKIRAQRLSLGRRLLRALGRTFGIELLRG
ncbi:MAG: HlyD family efflux transporter periplasmic adaptor subunit [Planctomycetaceae bacterium]|nr:HlyD family efflux transporter periplasmic adaptor subunit [Planctomycetaceae bacterium]